MTETTDPAASALDGIRERAATLLPMYPDSHYMIDALVQDVPRLLKAVEAALKLTEPTGEVHRDLDGNEEGGVVRVVRCDVLREAITAALAGKEAGDACE